MRSSSIPANTTRTSSQETDSAGVSTDKNTQLSEKDQKVKGKLEQLSANNPKALPIVIVETQADLEKRTDYGRSKDYLEEVIKNQEDKEDAKKGIIRAFVANGKAYFVLEHIG